MTACPLCGATHTSTDTVALHRFDPNQPTTYRARYPFAPERTTRAAAKPCRSSSTRSTASTPPAGRSTTSPTPSTN